MPWLVVLVPLFGGVGVYLAGQRRRGTLAPTASVVLVMTIALGLVLAQDEATAAYGWGGGIQLTLSLTGFARVMVVLVPAIALPIALYATSGEAEDPALPKLVALLVGFVGVMELLVAAGDLLTLLIGWELVGVLSWVLIGHHWREADVPPRAAHAFVTTRFGDVGLYLAAGAAFAGAGTFSYESVGTLDRRFLEVVAAGVLLAAAAKSAQLPFSPWLFSAMAGPTPVSALLHSATMVAAGAYALIRLGPAFGSLDWFGPAVMAIGLATALSGGVVAFIQTDFKRSLAASTSAQYGLMLTAIGAGSVAAAGAQLVTQAAFKALLFIGAGVAIHATGSGDLGRMRLGRALPAVAAMVGVGTLALAAVPPTGGAYSKEAILGAAVEAGPWVGAGIVLAGFLSALYAGRLQLLAYGSEPRSRPGSPRQVDRRPGPAELAALGGLAGATLALSVLWVPVSRGIVEEFSGAPLPEGTLVEFGLSMLSVLVGFVLVWVLDRRGRLLALGLPAAAQSKAGDWLGVPTLARVAVVDPVLALSRALARFDDRVIDAGIRGVAALAAAVSRLLSWWGEKGIDGVVWGVAGTALRAGDLSRQADERGVDRTVDGLAAGVGRAGHQSRKVQSGLSHHYFVIAGAGVLAAILIGIIGRY